jgi:hypothetical protein
MTDETPLEVPKKRNYHRSGVERANISARNLRKAATIERQKAIQAASKLFKTSNKLAKKAAAATNMANKFAGKSSNNLVTGEDIIKASISQKRALENEDIEIAFKANEGPQSLFLSSPEKEILYGGSAGGGKSYAMLADPMRYATNKNSRALLIRRNMPELLELIDKSRDLYPKAFPTARFKEKEHRWEFPSGATLQFNFVESDPDVHRFQGQSFSWIGVDELTHYPTPFVWDYLRSRLRTTDVSLPVYMRASSNPGGVGGWWVKKMFVDPAKWGEPFWATDISTGNILRFPRIPSVPKELWGKPLFKRRFIPAKLTDNPYLMQSNDYLASLASLSEVQRKRLLEGDWDIAEDTAFPEFDRAIHTCEPFEIPSHWFRFRAADYGYVDPTAVVWFAVSPDNTLFVYRELLEKGLDGDALADKIIDMEWDDPGILNGPLDSASWSAGGYSGTSPAETMIRKGVRWIKTEKGAGSRVRGKIEIHKRMRINPLTGNPGLIIFNTCKELIRVIPILPLDPKNREDIDTRFVDDHIYDAVRYGVSIKTTWSLHPGERAYLESERPVVFDEIFGA